MRIYILLAHPDRDSFNGRLADAYEAAAIARGHEVRRQNLGEMTFDPVLWHGYRRIQPLEPDLVAGQQNITWCEKWVIFYPIWWGAVPALLKGFFDRALYSDFAYRYHDKDPFWDKLLKGRSAHVITASDAPTASYGGSTATATSTRCAAQRSNSAASSRSALPASTA